MSLKTSVSVSSQRPWTMDETKDGRLCSTTNEHSVTITLVNGCYIFTVRSMGANDRVYSTTFSIDGLDLQRAMMACKQ